MLHRPKLYLFIVIIILVMASGKADSFNEEAQYKKWWRLIPFSNAEGKWGYRTRGRGKIVIPPRFEDAQPFLNRYAKVAIHGQEAWINLSGEIVFSSRFPVSEGLYVIKLTSWLGFLGVRPKYGYADMSGQYIIQPVFDNAYDFSEGLAGVRIDGKYGYINKLGKMVIAPQFIWAGSFSEGLAAVLFGDREGYIDKHGEMVIPPRFIWADQFSEGLAAVLVGNKWGYIDTGGYMVTNPEFEIAWPFFSGSARVEADGKWWYIDRKGEVVIPAKLLKKAEKCNYKIASDDIPHSFDLNYFKTSSNIHGYHPELGLIFNARGWAFSRTFQIPEGKYSLQLTAEGPPDLEIVRMMNISLVPAIEDKLRWPNILKKTIYIKRNRDQYLIGPWNIPAGSYKLHLSLLNDPVKYTEQGKIIYDKNFYITVENIFIAPSTSVLSPEVPKKLH